MPSRATIQLRPRHAVIDVDGQDISHVCRRLTVEAEPNDLPVITAELIITELTKIDVEDAIFHVGSDTRAALLALGWTPPDDDAEDDPDDMKESTRDE